MSESTTATLPLSSSSSSSSSGILEQSKNLLPWHCYAMVFAASCITVGILWDISWHLTIGRDTFWTPAHMVIYLGGIVAGLCAGWLCYKATFLSPATDRLTAVKLWGAYGPIGAWVCIWGTLAMLVSAPFDDWWHNTYGLDVKIISPPHSILAAGMHHVVVGAVLLVLSHQNRAPAHRKTGGSILFIVASGIMLTLASTILIEFSWPNYQHASTFYYANAALYPTLLIAIARSSRLPFPATIAAGIFMLIICSLIWILPLFKASPMLAPIYNPVDRMVPPPFPVLLIVPALAIDLIMRTVGKGKSFLRDLVIVIAAAAAYVTLVHLAQWNFSKFLISPAADNHFFAGNRCWPYSATPGDWKHRFWDANPSDPNSRPVSVTSFGITFIVALVTSTVGLIWGNWMAKVKR